MMLTHKYCDQNVRDDPRLTRLATDYLEQYTGSFQFLLDMKNRSLPYTVGMIRAILNCMLIDPNVAEMPVPKSKEHMPRQLTIDEVVEDTMDAVKPRKRGHFKLKSKFNKPFGISARVNARCVHRIAPGPAFLYVPEPVRLFGSESYYPQDLDKHYTCELHWLCKSSRYGMGTPLRVELLDEADAKKLLEDPNWKPCKVCEFRHEQLQEGK